MLKYHLHRPTKKISGTIHLDGSKSISNRALIIQALCTQQIELSRLSSSDDSNVLLKALKSPEPNIDIGAAGTSMRFLTAFLATQQGKRVLTGSARMKERPIGVLVTALKQLGADIRYLEQQGYPPLEISGKSLEGGTLEIDAGVSSQYLSALLMIAPTLSQGIKLRLNGSLVSRPYLVMTLELMKHFGVEHTWSTPELIFIEPQEYRSQSLAIEADWSAASYYYSIVALAEEADIELVGLYEESWQGDSVLPEIYQQLGVTTTFEKDSIRLRKRKHLTAAPLSYNFLECPDIAQSVAVSCAGLKRMGSFTGLKTLRIKETDRIEALNKELQKTGFHFSTQEEPHLLSPIKAFSSPSAIPSIQTYHDHRMAMAFAPLALSLPQGLIIEDPLVVTKSYPQFWEHLKLLGFRIESI